MYSPFEPNNYHKIAEVKRRRIERLEANVEPTTQRVDHNVSTMSAEELIKRRLASSAALGIGRAVHQMTDIEEAEAKAKVASGDDRKSKIKSLLSQLSEGSGAAPSNSSHLEFQSSASGHSVVATNVGLSKPPLGKPSSCLLVKNFATREDMNPTVLHSFGAECARFGVVKDIQLKLRAEGPEEETVRLFVRFDTVTTAYKAAERLNGQLIGGRFLVVCFVPQTFIDSQPNESCEWEVAVKQYL